MSNFQLFKAAWTNPRKLVEARKTGFAKVVLYFLLLALLSAIPIIQESIQAFKGMQGDIKNIVQKLPDFQIKNGKLTTDTTEKGFIYQGDLFTFTFDPQDKRSLGEIRSDTTQNKISLAMNSHNLIAAMPDSELFAQLSNLIPEESTYEEVGLEGFQKGDFHEIFSNLKLSPASLVAAGGIIVYSLFISLITDIAILSFSGWIYTKMRRIPMSLFENFKLMIYVSTVPLILTTLIQLIADFPSIASIFLVSTLILYFYVVGPLTPKTTQSPN